MKIIMDSALSHATEQAMTKTLSTIKLDLPLNISITKRKKFNMGINAYRNMHFRALATAKRNYHDAIVMVAPKLRYKIKRCEIEITLYPKSRRRMDVSNFCSICEKFTNDSLTRLKYWKDDDYTTIYKSTYKFGEVDKENPRFEYVIKVKEKE
jgi:Holliday junction resolvase RusA-like endonuclease